MLFGSGNECLEFMDCETSRVNHGDVAETQCRLALLWSGERRNGGRISPSDEVLEY